MTRRRTLLTYGLVVVAVQVVLVAGVWIAAPHNGGDNAGYVSLAHSLLEGEGYVEAWDPARPLHTKYPPLFPALLAAAVALGARTWAALKLVPALATIAAAVLAFLWAERRRGLLFGAALAVLLAAAPGVLWYSHWVLSDVPFLALTLLALWALERGGPPAPDREESGGGGRHAGAWLALGMGAAVLAYFTRSAGLPLLVAVAGWLVLRRRWGGLAGFAVVAGAPALLWWLRGRGGGADYVGEFWMVDPYDPSRGTVGAGGLVGRVLDNGALYATRHVPEGLLGAAGGAWTVVGLALLALAFGGWAIRWRREPGEGDTRPGALAGLDRVHVAELFLPLYAGLILLWPQVWSGDRFALPLFPLLLFYAGDALLRLVRRLSPRGVGLAGVVAFLVVAVPAAGSWTQQRDGARACADLMRTLGAGPFACHGLAWTEFIDATRWAGANLPEGSVVLTRKPRIFYVMGGTPSRTYPFTADPDAFAAAARDVGARYVLLDFVGRQGPIYVGGVVRARPEMFCSVAAFGRREGGATQLLGIVEPSSGAGGGVSEDGAVRVPACPPAMSPGSEVAPPELAPGVVPLLAR